MHNNSVCLHSFIFPNSTHILMQTHKMSKSVFIKNILNYIEFSMPALMTLTITFSLLTLMTFIRQTQETDQLILHGKPRWGENENK